MDLWKLHFYHLSLSSDLFFYTWLSINLIVYTHKASSPSYNLWIIYIGFFCIPNARFAHALRLPPLHDWNIAETALNFIQPINQPINQSTLLLSGVFSMCLHRSITHTKQHKKCLNIEITFLNVFFILLFIWDSFLAKL